MVTKEITVAMKEDANVSTAALVVQKAGEFKSSIYIEAGVKRANAKSIMGMMIMPLTNGEVLKITAEGADEEAAVRGLEDFLQNK